MSSMANAQEDLQCRNSLIVPSSKCCLTVELPAIFVIMQADLDKCTSHVTISSEMRTEMLAVLHSSLFHVMLQAVWP